MNKILIISFILALLGCSTVSKRVTYEKNDIKNIAADNSRNSSVFLDKYDYDKAMDYLKESLKYNTLVDNIQGIILNYANMGKIFLLKKDYESALKYYNMALEIGEKNIEIKSDKEKSFVYNGLGEAYLFNGDYENAEKNFNKALEFKIDDEARALVETNIGRIYFNKKDDKKALNYFLRSLSIYEKLYNEFKLSSAKNYSFILYFVSRSYYRSDKFENALQYIKKALEIDKLIENSSGIADDYFIMGRIYEKNDADESIKYYLKAKAIYRLIDDLNQYLNVSNILASLYLKKELFYEFYCIKKEVFLLTKAEEKNKNINYLNNILNFMYQNNGITCNWQGEFVTIRTK